MLSARIADLGATRGFTTGCYTLADSYTLADDLTFERANPDSVWNNFFKARENARQMRHCISAEMWTCLNLAYLRIGTLRIEDIWKAAPENFYADVAHDVDTVSGVAESTMTVTRAGVFCKSAATSSGCRQRLRCSWPSLPRCGNTTIHRMTTGRCACARRWTRTRAATVSRLPERVLDLLVTDARLPRSLCSSSSTIAVELGALATGPGPTAAALELAGQLHVTLRRQWSRQAERDNLEHRLRHLLDQSHTLHNLIIDAHIRYDADHAPLI